MDSDPVLRPRVVSLGLHSCNSPPLEVGGPWDRPLPSRSNHNHSHHNSQRRLCQPKPPCKRTCKRWHGKKNPAWRRHCPNCTRRTGGRQSHRHRLNQRRLRQSCTRTLLPNCVNNSGCKDSSSLNRRCRCPPIQLPPVVRPSFHDPSSLPDRRKYRNTIGMLPQHKIQILPLVCQPRWSVPRPYRHAWHTNNTWPTNSVDNIKVCKMLCKRATHLDSVLTLMRHVTNTHNRNTVCCVSSDKSN